MTITEQKYGTIITDLGVNAVFLATTEGLKINIDTFAVGDGDGEYYMPTTDMTALKNELWRGAIGSYKVNEKSPNMITVKGVVPADVGGFTIRELALFSDTGNMIAVANMPDTEKVLMEDGIFGTLEVSLNIVLTNAGTLNFVIDSSTITATMEDLEQAKNEILSQIPTKEIHHGVLLQADWAKEEDVSNYPYVLAFPIETTASQFPTVVIHKSALDIATEAELCPTVESFDGGIFIWARDRPTADIPITIMIESVGGSGIGYSIPIASETQLGGVKIGNGIAISSDGTISAKADEALVETAIEAIKEEFADVVATEDEVNEAFNGVFGGGTTT